jgi:hypothetical protein
MEEETRTATYVRMDPTWVRGATVKLKKTDYCMLLGVE